MEPETCFHGIQEDHLQKSRFFIFLFLGFLVLTFISHLLPDFVSSMFEIFAGVAGSILCSTSTDIASKVQQQCNMLDTFRWRGLLVP